MFCLFVWLSLDELSAIVKRDKIYLINFRTPEDVRSNSLEMLFPGVPNHPRQKYKNTYKEMKRKINPKYEEMRTFIERIPDVFEQEGRCIFEGRNVIKAFM